MDEPKISSNPEDRNDGKSLLPFTKALVRKSGEPKREEQPGTSGLSQTVTESHQFEKQMKQGAGQAESQPPGTGSGSVVRVVGRNRGRGSMFRGTRPRYRSNFGRKNQHGRGNPFPPFNTANNHSSTEVGRGSHAYDISRCSGDLRGRCDYNRGHSNYNRGRGEYNRGRGEYNRGRGEYNRGRGIYNRGRGNYNRGRGEYNRGLGDYNQGRRDYNQRRGNSSPGRERGQLDPASEERINTLMNNLSIFYDYMCTSLARSTII